MQLELAPLRRDAVRDVKPALMALFGGAGFLLLICCVNVSSLLQACAADDIDYIPLSIGGEWR